jgi:hypothetical protein
MSWLRQLVAGLSEAHIHAQVSPCGICGGNGTGFSLNSLFFCPVNIIPPWLSMLIYHLGLVGGCSSETYSHPIDMNNNSPHGH